MSPRPLPRSIVVALGLSCMGTHCDCLSIGVCLDQVEDDTGDSGDADTDTDTDTDTDSDTDMDAKARGEAIERVSRDLPADVLEQLRLD